MERHRCGYCRKLVRDKPLFGTLHVCLSKGERIEVDYYRWAAREQKRMVEQYERDKETCLGYLDSRPRVRQS